MSVAIVALATLLFAAPALAAEADTATSVTSSANPSIVGQPVTFTATVTVVTGSGTPTGTVTFLDGGAAIGTGTLSGGIATFTTSALSGGTHTITASYPGSGSVRGSKGALIGNPQVVNEGGTTTSVTSSANPSVVGQPVTFTATVSPTAGSGTPTGTVTFLDGGAAIGTGTLSGGAAAFTTSALIAGSHTITISYGGDSSYSGSDGSMIGNPQLVQVPTTTAVASSANPTVIGQSVMFTATVTPTSGSGTPTGTVTFFDGGSAIGSGTVSGGVATFMTSALAVGSHTISASYGGDQMFVASTGSLTGNPQVVGKASSQIATAVYDSSSGSPWNGAELAGASAYDTAVITQNGTTPTGTVTYSLFDDGSCSGPTTSTVQVSVTNGNVPQSSATAALAAGTYSFEADYSGDASYMSSSGKCEPFTVATPPASGGTSGLNVSMLGSGTGSVSSSVAGIACPGSCSASYPTSTAVVLTATPAGGSTFAGWGGACSGMGTCSVTMDSLETVTASFTVTAAAVRCTVTPTTNTVVLRKHRNSNARRRPAGTITVSVKCDQAAAASLNGVLTQVRGPTRKHGQQRMKTLKLRSTGASVRPGIPVLLTLRLPRLALTALKHHRKEWVVFTLTATNTNGTSRVTVKLPKLRGIR